MDYDRSCGRCIWSYSLWVGEDDLWPCICICPALDDERYSAVHDTLGEFGVSARHTAAIAAVCQHYVRRPPGLRRSVLRDCEIEAERNAVATEIARERGTPQ